MENIIAKVGTYIPNDVFPRHDFLLLENSDLSKIMGLIAASQKQLEEQIKSKMRLDPNAKEIRYFYYEVTDVRDTNKISSTE